MRRLEVRFRPAGRLTFFACAKKVSKETHPGIRVSLRSTSLPPVLLREPAYKGHPWPFKPLAASMRLVPLRNTYVRPSDGEFARMQVSSFKQLGAVGMPLYSITLCVGIQPQTIRVLGGIPTQSVGTINKLKRHRRSPSPAPQVWAGIGSRQEAEWNRCVRG